MRFGQPHAINNAWIFRVIVILLGAAILTFPAWVNGSPYLFDDADGYFRSGKSIVTQMYKAIGGQSSLSRADTSYAQDPPAATKAENYQITLISARSPFYGLLLYLSGVSAGLWGIVLIQAMAASFVLWRAAYAFALSREFIAFFSILSIAAIGTSLPWYVNFAMPDIWLSLCVLMFGSVIFSPRQINTADFIVLIILTSATVLFHRSNFPVLFIAIVAAAIIALTFKLSERLSFRCYGDRYCVRYRVGVQYRGRTSFPRAAAYRSCADDEKR